MDFKELFIENVSFLGTFAKTKFDNVLYYSRMTAFGGNRIFVISKLLLRFYIFDKYSKPFYCNLCRG